MARSLTVVEKAGYGLRGLTAAEKAGYGQKGLAATEIAYSSLLSGLVSYWKLDEASGNAADSVDANTLTLAGGVTYGAGKLGNCAIMDGVDSNLGIAADVANLSFTGDFTICCWVWVDSDGTDPLGHVIVGKLESYFQLEYWLVWERYYGADFVRFYVAPSIGVVPTSVDSQDLSTDAWHFARA